MRLSSYHLYYLITLTLVHLILYDIVSIILSENQIKKKKKNKQHQNVVTMVINNERYLVTYLSIVWFRVKKIAKTK